MSELQQSVGSGGVELSVGVEQIASLTSGIVWIGRRPYFCEGAAQVLPNFSSALLSDTLRPGNGDRRPKVVVPFERTDAVEQWGRDNGAVVIGPPVARVETIADKTRLSDLLKAAGVAPIPSQTLQRTSKTDTERIWAAFGEQPVVVQLPENNLTGAGTRFAASPHELKMVFDEWTGQRVKVAPFVSGGSITISGCVARDRTVIAGLSRQLVGIPELTHFRGSHCGNQLLDGSELPPAVTRQAFQIATSIGDELRRRDYLGMFGVDCVLTPESVIRVIEINPRIQMVTAIASVAEIESGLLPTFGVHVLAHLLDRLPAASDKPLSLKEPLGHLILYATRTGTVTKAPVPGRYCVRDGQLTPCTASMAEIPAGSDGMLWAFAAAGDSVTYESGLAAVQTRTPVARSCEQQRLTDHGESLSHTMRSLYEVE